MTMKRRMLLASTVACSLLMGVAPAFARKPPPTSAPSSSHPASLEQAVRQVQHQTHGHILAADKFSRGKTNIYRIKVLTPKGQVRVVQLHSRAHVQAQSSGKPRSDQGGH